MAPPRSHPLPSPSYISLSATIVFTFLTHPKSSATIIITIISTYIHILVPLTQLYNQQSTMRKTMITIVSAREFHSFDIFVAQSSSTVWLLCDAMSATMLFMIEKNNENLRLERRRELSEVDSSHKCFLMWLIISTRTLTAKDICLTYASHHRFVCSLITSLSYV